MHKYKKCLTDRGLTKSQLQPNLRHKYILKDYFKDVIRETHAAEVTQDDKRVTLPSEAQRGTRRRLQKEIPTVGTLPL